MLSKMCPPGVPSARAVDRRIKRRSAETPDDRRGGLHFEALFCRIVAQSCGVEYLILVPPLDLKHIFPILFASYPVASAVCCWWTCAPRFSLAADSGESWCTGALRGFFCGVLHVVPGRCTNCVVGQFPSFRLQQGPMTTRL